jgi:phenylacetate-CoA ligase
MSERNLGYYIKKLEEYGPIMIGGYPSSLYLLALANKKYGASKIDVDAVYTASETLFDHQRKAIEESFSCKVFNWYGNTELCGNIVECEEGELHVKYEHSRIEFLREDNTPCRPGETGRMVCTGFGNRAFPMIRYEVGDVATVAKSQKSRCGRGGLLIERVEGRKEDYILTGDDKLVGRLDHIFKDSVNVKEAQIIQNAKGKIIFLIVRNNVYSKNDENQILEEARLRLGREMSISFNYVDSIPRTLNGKYQFIVSSLNLSHVIDKWEH